MFKVRDKVFKLLKAHRNFLLYTLQKLFAMIILSGIALQMLVYALEQDQLYGIFKWLESPKNSSFALWFGTFLSILIWVLTQRLIAGKSLQKSVLSPFETLVEIIRFISKTAWLAILILGSVLLFQNPPSPILERHEVKVLRIYIPPHQSKPYKYYLEVSSWRGLAYETLRTLNWPAAKELADAVHVKIYIGEDWLGRVRVLKAEPVQVHFGSNK